jgi:hypothetical protein
MHRHDPVPRLTFHHPASLSLPVFAECLLMFSTLAFFLHSASVTLTHDSLASDGKLPCPLSRCSLVSGTVGLVDVGDFGYERVIGVRVGKHRAYGQKD